MALTWSVYNKAGTLVAKLRHAEDAAMMAAAFPGSQVKASGWVIYRETEGIAHESYDKAAALMSERLKEKYRALTARPEPRGY